MAHGKKTSFPFSAGDMQLEQEHSLKVIFLSPTFRHTDRVGGGTGLPCPKCRESGIGAGRWWWMGGVLGNKAGV